LRQVLSHEPEHATAHALLSLALLDLHRLHAAELEAGRALLADPELPLAHHAMVLVAMAKRDLARAERHLDVLVSLAPDDPATHHTRADWLESRGRLDQAQAALEHALSLAPDDAGLWAALGVLQHGRGRHEPAIRACARALELDPELPATHRLRGWLDLHEGHVAAAREHACYVLGQDPGDAEAIRLLVAARARKSPILGLWWRLQARLEQLDEGRRIVLLLGSFLLVRVLVVVLTHRGLHDAVAVLQWVWLGLCAYTWVGPGLFKRWLERELAKVRLRDDY
jgi:tetratricopeptide (TPR) repeat protein